MRIVLVRLSALGDIVHAWPLAAALRDADPTAHLSWVVEAPLAPLVDGHPAVDAVVPVATGRWRRSPFSVRTRSETGAFRSRIRELTPDLVIDAQGTVKSALVTHWSRAPRRVGLARPWRRELIAGAAYTETLPGSPGRDHVVATNLELVRAIGGHPPAGPPAPDGRWLADRAGAPLAGPWGSRYGVVLPGAGWRDKMVSVEVLAETARHLAERGLGVVVAWGPSERERAAQVAELGGRGVHVAPATDLLQLTALLGSAEAAVGGDTGPVHLAASLGVPTVAVFLTTDPVRNGPVGRRVAVVSGAAPGRGPAGSATTGRAREVTAAEVREAVDGVLEGGR